MILGKPFFPYLTCLQSWYNQETMIDNVEKLKQRAKELWAEIDLNNEEISELEDISQRKHAEWLNIVNHIRGLEK